MQQRGTNPDTMESECEEKQISHARGRNNSKLKVLVRSHAMREEASPPREPTPLVSPCIKLTPSPAESPNSLLVLSPSVSRGNSPARSSPSSTIVPSPTRCSSHVASQYEEDYQISDSEISPKYINNKMNKQNLEKSRNGCNCCAEGETNNKMYKTRIIVEESSQATYAENRKPKNDLQIYECSNQNCVKCAKGQDRNMNNNFSSNVNHNLNCNNTPNMLTVSRASLRGKLKQQSSSQGSFEGSTSNSPCLSRDSSSEQYTDTSGINLEEFIPETLNRNAKDRALMLRIEQELVNLAKDTVKTHYKFPPMSSYQRMLVHRCAAYFGMDHNIESSGKCVVVNKTKSTRIPDVQFKEHIKSDLKFSEEPRRSILKRDSNSIEDYNFKSPDRQHSLENRRSKSFEEREEEYAKVRRRIFSVENPYNSNDELAWPELPWSSIESDSTTRYRLQPPEHHCRSGSGRLLKVQSEDTSDATMRPCVAKSYSFGGYGGVSTLTRGDSVISTRSAGPRLFSKQDSAASSVSWRLSPSSSGYKTQSQRSESVTPSPTSTPYLSGQDSTNSVATNTSETQIEDDQRDTQVVWAVTDIQSVPKGSIIINPQTGQPVKNNDGTIYHYDPTNPPPGLNNNTTAKPPPSPQKSSSPIKTKDRPMSPKKRISRTSPIKKSITNSSTSPSLPFTPPPQINRTFPYIPPNENISNLPIQQQYPVYGNNYGPVPESSLQLYQQPCFVYAPYGAYDGHVEPQLQEVSGYYLNLGDGSNNSGPQSITYPTAPVWNQSMYYNQPTNPQQRFTISVPNQTGPYISSTYPTNYVPQHTQNLSSIPPPPPQNPEVLPVYPQQSIQVLYSATPAQPNTMLYPNQSVIYAQNPMYTAAVYPNPSIPYPQNTSTPNSCTSSISNTAYCGQVHELNAASNVTLPNYGQLSQNMSQMNINAIPPQNFNPTQNMKPFLHGYDSRLQKNVTPKSNKFSTPKGFGMNSSQSSTGTSSPAMTVVAGYTTSQNAALYRTPPETPTTPHIPAGYSTNFVQPMLIRQMNSIQASPPVTNRSSRSPTPGSDVPQHLDSRHRVIPPIAYQGMPYVLSSDARFIPGRGQPSSYRQPLRQQCFQSSENKSHKNRKSRGNKVTNMQQPNTKT